MRYISKVIQNLDNISRSSAYGLSFVLGLVLVLSFAPFFFFPALFAISGLLFLSDRIKNYTEAFWLGFLFGLGNFIFGLYWLAHALLVEPLLHAWLIPIAIPGISCILAIFNGLITLICYRFSYHYTLKYIFFICFWLITELIRARLFTGFPWNLIGYSLNDYLPLMQICSLLGIYGASMLALLIGGLPYIYFRAKNKIMLLVIIITLLSSGIWGYYRINYSNLACNKQNLRIRVVQANVPQLLKWDEHFARDFLFRHLALSQKIKHNDIDYIIWPETAVVFNIHNQNLIKLLANVIPPKTALITGCLRRHPDNPELVSNSLAVINHEGSITDIYDKSHLVPMGEFLPFKNIIPYKIIPGVSNLISELTPGTLPKTLKGIDANAPFLPLICYEAIFPHHSVDKNHLPTWILNLSNDGWYGYSIGPFQHLALSQARAIEKGIPLVRAANTGISAVFDSFGRKIISTKLATEEVVDFILPCYLAQYSVYFYYGDLSITIIIGFVLIGALLYAYYCKLRR